MIAITFALGILFNAASAFVFLLNFFKPVRIRWMTDKEGNRIGRPYRHPASLVCASASFGWCVALARELHWLPRPVTTVLISASIPLGLLGALIVFNSRRQG